MVNTLDATIIYAVFFFYFIAMFLVGCYASTKIHSNADYILGGRSVGPYTSAISAGASDMSSWLILGLPGAVFASGLVEGLWISLGLVLGAYINWTLVATRLRDMSEKLNTITVPSYLQNRFNKEGTALKMTSSIVILIFFTLYIASGLKSGSLLFGYIFSASDFMGLIVTALVVVFYTFLGGYLAICWTDLIQGLLMLASLVFLAIFGYYALFDANISIEQVKPEAFDVATTWITGASLMAWGLGYFGQPHILSRFMGIRSSSDVPVARRVAIIWMIVCLLLSTAIGMIGIGYGEISSLPGVNGIGGDKERIFLVLTHALFHPFFAGLILAAVLAALMSTTDSQLLILGSAVTEDLSFFKDAKDSTKFWASRISVVIFALIGLIIALNNSDSILSLVSYAWGGFGASFGPLMILSVCWKGTTSSGAIAGMISGASSIFIFKNFVTIEGEYFYELLPSFFISMLVIILVSLITSKPNEETLAQFE